MPWVPIAPHVRPAWWFICFARSSPVWWLRNYLPGRYKHVSAFGFIPGQKLWVFSSWTFGGIEFAIIPDGLATDAINALVEDALVLEFVPPAEDPPRFWWPFAHCVGHVAALTGVKSRALLPDRFLKDCLAAGAKILDDDGQHQETTTGGGKAADLPEHRPA